MICFHCHFSTVLACRLQKVVELPSYKRGCHVITRKVLEQLPELGEFDVGLVNFFSAPSYIQIQNSCLSVVAKHIIS